MNENPDGLPEDFVKRILSGIDSRYLSAYPEYARLIKKIASANRISEASVILTNGSDGAIRNIFEAFISGGDRVLITDPTFAMYPVYCRMFDAEPKTISYGGDLKFPAAAYYEAIEPDVRMAVLVNPNNPTGSVIDPADMQRIFEKCRKYDVLLLVDEAYHYYYDGTPLDRIVDHPNLLVLRTFSKLCGLASIRIGYAAGHPAIISGLATVKSSFDVNGVAVRFAESLLEEPHIIASALDQTRQGKSFLIERLKDSNIPFRDGHANFLLIQAPGKVLPIIDGLRERGILVGGNFRQAALKDYLRVTVGSRKQMAFFWDRFLPLWSDNCIAPAPC